MPGWQSSSLDVQCRLQWTREKPVHTKRMVEQVWVCCAAPSTALHVQLLQPDTLAASASSACAAQGLAS
jgi:hypothetical protein